MSELSHYKQEAIKLAEKIEEEEAKAAMSKLAEKMFNIYQAFINAGFSEDKAWWMAGSMFAKAIDVDLD